MTGGGGPPVTPVSITKPMPFGQRRPSESNAPQTVNQSTPPHSAKLSGSALSSPGFPSPVAPETKGVSHLNLPENLYYLHNAEKERPLVYQSPYATGGGFTDAYLPAPEASPKTRPRGPSMSEQFLSKQNQTYQEQVAQKMIEDKARLQQENRERVQRRLSQSQAQRPIFSHYQQTPQHTALQHQPQHIPMSAIQNATSHKPNQPPLRSGYYGNASSDNYQSYSHYSPTYAVNAYQQSPMSHNPYSQQHPSPFQQPDSAARQGHEHGYNAQQPYPKPTGLQFSSPQDFQMQMERASQQRPQAQNDQGYQKFYHGLQAAAGSDGSLPHGHGHGHPHPHGHGHGHHDSAGGGGGQGSPLKYEMDGGGETLPMMRDGSRF